MLKALGQRADRAVDGIFVIAGQCLPPEEPTIGFESTAVDAARLCGISWTSR